MAIKKIIFSLLFILAVPAYCFLMDSCFYTRSINYTNLFAMILYLFLFIFCIFYLRKRKVKYGDVLFAFLIGLITIAYTIPLHYIGIVAGICTALVFLVCREMLREIQPLFVWIRAGIKSNIAILGSISLFYLIIFIAHRDQEAFRFSPLLVLKAWAPAVSEELIFRVFFPMMIFRLFKLEETFWNKIWIFLIVTIPFSLLHCIDPIMENNLSQVINRYHTSMVNSFISAVLISRYGFFYGVYAHAISDFLAMSVWVN